MSTPHEARPSGPQNIAIQDYDYPLPDERIAKFPLPDRDASKLLIYRKGHISETVFRNIASELPQGAVLLFNDSRVIHARLRFTTPAGKAVEIFCLEPAAPAEYQMSLSSRQPVIWHCLVGNNRQWKSGALELMFSTPAGPVALTAERLEHREGAFEIRFSWHSPAQLSFGEVLAAAGALPLPPYLHRDSEPDDEERYQTIYARQEGSVAAPTAGLHFTERVFEDLDKRGIERLFVTLHVGAGTFKPVKSETIGDHHMHEETVIVNRDAIARIAEALEQGRPVIPVGTTSMRVLESLYWHGLTTVEQNAGALHLRQWTPYETQENELSAVEVLRLLIARLDQAGQSFVEGQTQLLIAPGYQFRIAGGLMTNFHQPRSTLLLLIAAWTGQDWRRMYEYALDNDFRFLSYGDGSLLL
jgi:S-adenosylmethionine:tRNA ribosyltransferase-isomerase